MWRRFVFLLWNCSCTHRSVTVSLMIIKLREMTLSSEYGYQERPAQISPIQVWALNHALWFASVFFTCFQEVDSAPVPSILREHLILCYIKDSWIIMLQGRNYSHVWQPAFLSLRDIFFHSNSFGAAPLSTGPSGWACRPTSCFHLLVLPSRKKNTCFSKYRLNSNIYGLKRLWEPAGSSRTRHLAPYPWRCWLTLWCIAWCHQTTLTKSLYPNAENGPVLEELGDA